LDGGVVTPLDAALSALPTALDPYDAAKARAMVTGYTAAWDDANVEVLDVEREFQLPLIDDLGLEHPHWLRGGKIDLVLRWRESGAIVVVDHKTSGEDVSVGSTYRKRLILNGQASQYMHAARALLGVEPASFIFDVLCKPDLRPSQVPTLDDDGVKIVVDKNGQRVRTKDGKKWRETASAADGYELQGRPETPVEYERRILAAMAADPGGYFAQIEITRTDAELASHTASISRVAARIDLVRARGLATPNDDACHKYGSPCPWWDVCTGTASLDDDTRFVKRGHVHDELHTPVPAGKRLLTNSRRQSFEACTEKHDIEYERGFKPLVRSWNLDFGTAIHTALENYWNARRTSAARAA
jgi:hypothetical protein